MTEATKKPAPTRVYFHEASSRLVRAANAGAVLNHIAAQQVRVATPEDIFAAASAGKSIEEAGK